MARKRGGRVQKKTLVVNARTTGGPQRKKKTAKKPEQNIPGRPKKKATRTVASVQKVAKTGPKYHIGKTPGLRMKELNKTPRSEETNVLHIGERKETKKAGKPEKGRCKERVYKKGQTQRTKGGTNTGVGSQKKKGGSFKTRKRSTKGFSRNTRKKGNRIRLTTADWF